MIDDNISSIVKDIKNRGYIALEDILLRKESESFFIEFKVTENVDYTSQRTLYKSDRKNLAKAISGFGNSEGGVLIWGINSSGNINDFAKALIPIKGVDNFKSLLESFIKLVTIPPHKTVENFIVRKSSKDKDGFVITIIPKNDDRPYQNINEGDYKYYMRAGDSFVPIPHGVLQGMFGRSPQSNVFWMFNVGNNGIPIVTTDQSIKLQVGLMAVNNGLGIAEDIYGFSRAFSPGDACTISAQISDAENYSFTQSYGIEFSFMSKQGFRLGYKQRSQMLIMDFELMPPFDKNFYVEMLIGAKNQQAYDKLIEKTPAEMKKMYEECIIHPTIDTFTHLWGGTDMLKVKK